MMEVELQPLLALVVIVGGAMAIWFFGRQADARRRKRFDKRSGQDAVEIWDRYYRSSGVSLESVEQAIRMIGEATGVPSDRLRPEDRFPVELAPEGGWEFDDDLAEIRWYLEARSKGSSDGIRTVDDLVRVLNRIERAPEGDRSVAPDQRTSL